jgi:hypothetical protein
MNLILERTDRVHFYTDMNVVLAALGLRASNFDWYLSDVETNYYGTDFSNDDRWISGVELEEFLKLRTVQFIWAVFSAFPVGYRREISEAPYADGNPRFWQGVEVFPQLNDALFEIVCWDSSATVLVGLPSEAEQRFIGVYPETQSLIAASNGRHLLQTDAKFAPNLL